MTRAEARRRILRVLRESGPRKRTVLVGLAGGHETLVDELLGSGYIVQVGSKRGTKYGARPAVRG